MRTAVERAPLDHVVTVSAGVCDLATAGDASELMRLADGALYWAKEHGRNVVYRYTPEAVPELSARERAQRLARGQALIAVRALARAIDAKDPSTREHSERVARIASRIAEELGWTPERVSAMRAAALVHDVGKIGVPDAILTKPGALTVSEYAEVREHAARGAQIASEALAGEQVEWIRHHHERFGGGGYPEGLVGFDISEGARILALADAWDAMTSERAYQHALDPGVALAEARRCTPAQFCPLAVGALERCLAGVAG
jgi:putative nucleotidyltransferase with HDIG domain